MSQRMQGLVFSFPGALCPQGVMLFSYLFVTELSRHLVCQRAMRHLSGFHIDIFCAILPISLPSLSKNSQSEEEEDVFGFLRRRSSLGLSGYPLPEEEPGPGGPLTRAFRRIISIEEDPLPQLQDGGFEQPLSKCPEEEKVSQQRVEGQSQQARPLERMPTSPRGQPIGKEDLSKVRAHPILVHRCHLSPLYLSFAFEPKSRKSSVRSQVQLGKSGAASFMNHHICVLLIPACPAELSVTGETQGSW